MFDGDDFVVVKQGFLVMLRMLMLRLVKTPPGDDSGTGEASLLIAVVVSKCFLPSTGDCGWKT